MRPLTFGNVAQIDDVQIIYVISMTSWRTKWDSNWRYNSENISLRSRPNFRSCASKWPVERNPQKGAKIYFAPQSHRSSSRPGKWRDHPILVTLSRVRFRDNGWLWHARTVLASERLTACPGPM